MKKLIIYSGPSCVGKGPLNNALQTHYKEYLKEKKIGKITLHTNREMRKNEEEGEPYFFHKIPGELESLVHNNKKFISGWIRDKEQLQALDLDEAKKVFKNHDLVLLEIYHTLGAQLNRKEVLDYLSDDDIKVETIFISPLSLKEIENFKEMGIDIRNQVTKIMLLKLLRRAREIQNISLENKKVVINLIDRAQDAFNELQNACNYDHVIVNHDGEDSDHWYLPFPIGDAKRTLEIFVELLKNPKSQSAEKWFPDTM